jgi:hypothetical protein
VRLRLYVGSLLLVAAVAACSSSAGNESATAFGRACRALGDADALLFKSNWKQIQKDYALVGDEAPGIADASVRAAAIEISSRITKSSPDIGLARIIGGDSHDALLSSACDRRFGDDY